MNEPMSPFRVVDTGMPVPTQEELLARVNKVPPGHHIIGWEGVDSIAGTGPVGLSVCPELFQFQHAVHGRAIHSVDHTALAVALPAVGDPGEDAVSIEGKLSCLAPVVTEGGLTAVGRIVHRGRCLTVADVEVYGSDGKRCAKGLMTYHLVRALQAYSGVPRKQMARGPPQ